MNIFRVKYWTLKRGLVFLAIGLVLSYIGWNVLLPYGMNYRNANIAFFYIGWIYIILGSWFLLYIFAKSVWTIKK